MFSWDVPPGPYEWIQITRLDVSIELSTEIALIQLLRGIMPGNGFALITPILPPTPLSPGSQLLGIISWTQLRQFSKRRQWGTSPSFVTTLIPEVTGFQPFVSPDTVGSNISRLTIINYSSSHTKFLEETVDASALSGIATFGGFWTFVNGSFALLFGANVLYFAFGKLFVCGHFPPWEWSIYFNVDFPAIHAEGGLPGPDSAGIVAFIRERLVDPGPDLRSTEKDIDSQLTGPVPQPCGRSPELSTQVKEEDKSAQSRNRSDGLVGTHWDVQDIGQSTTVFESYVLVN
ncbi:hypothetical protein DFH09DRAFT_1099710 [Mycena vulgaris]|nr:hypothetical protein DFH09DRAFT_1099710 [Mycena vulgaris]